MKAVCIRVWVARFPDGWHVVVNIDGDLKVYAPTFATEAEARAMADEMAQEVRRVKKELER